MLVAPVSNLLGRRELIFYDYSNRTLLKELELEKRSKELVIVLLGERHIPNKYTSIIIRHQNYLFFGIHINAFLISIYNSLKVCDRQDDAVL
jgi:hypothetical protein